MNKDYDVIVIGAGNGGLAAAALTAKSGLKTLIVDKHNIPGGSATSFVRGRFEFETSLHELAAVGTEENPGAIRMLFKMLGADVEWCTHTDGTFRLVVPDEGIDADMPCGADNFCRKMEELVPGSGESTKRMLELGAQALAGLNDLTAPDYDRETFEKKYPDFFRMAGHTIHEVLDTLGMPLKAQHIVSTYWDYLGAPEDQMDFMTYARMLFSYVTYGAGQPKLRSHEISLALEKVIRDNGGEVWYNTEVRKILVKDKKAYGVVIGGKEYYADYIVSNAYPDLVYSYMIDADEVPERAVKLVNSRKPGLSFETVYLGMNRTAEELGITAYSTFISTVSDSNEQQRLATNTHDYGGRTVLNCLNLIIPDCTPEGTCQLFLTTAFYGNGWDDVTPEEYNSLKKRNAEKMIDACEKGLGISIRPYIEEIVIAAPPTFARYLNTPAGTPYGYQMNTYERFVQRAVTRDEENFIDNLYFAGATTHRGDGYSSAYLSGLDAGKAILADVKEKGGLSK